MSPVITERQLRFGAGRVIATGIVRRLLIPVLVALSPALLPAQTPSEIDHAADTTLLLIGSAADSIPGGRPTVVARRASAEELVYPGKKILLFDPFKLIRFLNVGYYRMLDPRFAVGGEIGIGHTRQDFAPVGGFGDDFSIILGGKWFVEGSGPDGLFLQGSLTGFFARTTTPDGRDTLDLSSQSLMLDVGLLTDHVTIFPKLAMSYRIGVELPLLVSEDVERYNATQPDRPITPPVYNLVSFFRMEQGTANPHFSISLAFRF